MEQGSNWTVDASHPDILRVRISQLESVNQKLLDALKELLEARCTSLDVVAYHPITGDALNREGLAALKAQEIIAEAERAQ